MNPAYQSHQKLEIKKAVESLVFLRLAGLCGRADAGDQEKIGKNIIQSVGLVLGFVIKLKIHQHCSTLHSSCPSVMIVNHNSVVSERSISSEVSTFQQSIGVANEYQSQDIFTRVFRLKFRED